MYKGCIIFNNFDFIDCICYFFNLFQQKLALGELSRLFSQLLGDSNVAIKQVALETFSQFAEETQHEMVVPDTLQRNPMLQEVVVNLLNQVNF